MSLETTITTALKDAMKSKDGSLLTIKSIRAAFQNLNTSGKEVTEDLRMKALQTMIKQRKEAAEIFKQNDRQDLLDVELFQISVIEKFLPSQMTEAEIEAEVKLAITETGATSIKEMGKVVGLLSKKLVGRADGKIISEFTKKLLA